MTKRTNVDDLANESDEQDSRVSRKKLNTRSLPSTFLDDIRAARNGGKFTPFIPRKPPAQEVTGEDKSTAKIDKVPEESMPRKSKEA